MIGLSSDITPDKLSKAFSDIRSHSSFKNLKLKVAVFHVKNSSRKPFLEETHAEFMDTLNTYVGGAMAFAQEAIKRMFEDNGKTPLAEGGEKKGTIVFTGTLGAMRTNTNFAAYGASRSGVRSLAQALAKEYSPAGIHVVHTIMNGGIKDEDVEAQKTGKSRGAEEVGQNYSWLANQGPSLWTHELDMRPPQEKF
ncbi:hypothetical protein OEA41_006245 [Lepraria neglecta]|uniref:NAD(P)-binding protein n=1 Tax=Lepraria neglecta TaxID=209136 RepID=A0AAD9Z795_9LECA|nr:hypothetical protein OEA41_006245 [Lepraria neglecta]